MELLEGLAYLITILAAVGWVVGKVPKDVWAKIANVAGIVFFCTALAGSVGSLLYVVSEEVVEWQRRGTEAQRLRILNAGLQRDLDLTLQQWSNERERNRRAISEVWWCEVTSLDAEGEGSFQWCLDRADEDEAMERFKVLSFRQPGSYRLPTLSYNNIYISGRTAPSPYTGPADSVWADGYMDIEHWIDDNPRKYYVTDSMGVNQPYWSRDTLPIWATPAYGVPVSEWGP